ncbi:MAG: ATP-binding cassette domain-containing protein, partial [Longimicrobiales bacterium]|nr:ATP-binding cassette domain-containing protein [Longimicrobiales bacterium]
MSDPLVRLRGVQRRFGRVQALAGAELDLHAGEVHGVLGANGAGKSTLFNVLGGLLAPDAGSLEIEGVQTALGSPRDAWSRGIGLVHQHFTLVPALSVRENLALGLRGRSLTEVGGVVEATMERTGLRVPLEATVSAIGVGDRPRTEILKTL